MSTAALSEPDSRAELGLSPEEPLLEGRPPAGPSLSPSRAADFMTCPLLYRFRVIDRIPEAPSPAATRGTLLHAVLEKLFDLPADERTLQRASAMVGPQWQQMLADEPELSALLEIGAAHTTTAEAAAVDSATVDTATVVSVTGDTATVDTVRGDRADAGQVGRAGVAHSDAAEPGLPAFLDGADVLLERYFDLEDPRRLEPAERELRVQVELGSGLLLRGFVDRLDISPAGDMRVVDYKTGRAPSPGFEAKAMFQMRFYALVLWRLYGKVPRLLQLLYLGSGEVLRYEPDEADLRATEVKVLALWRAIERATQTGDWRPSPSRLCDWCDHRLSRCPAWGGTLPDLPAADGAVAADGPASQLPRVPAAAGVDQVRAGQFPAPTAAAPL